MISVATCKEWFDEVLADLDMAAEEARKIIWDEE